MRIAPILPLVVAILMSSLQLYADIQINTFQDLNNNGLREGGEPLITGLTVTAYDDLARVLPFVATLPGVHLLPGEFVSGRLRIVVTGYNPSLRQGKNHPTTVFFATDGATIDIPVITQQAADPNSSQILIPCYEKGASRLKKDSPGFVSFPFTASGVSEEFGGTGPIPSKDAAISQIGSTWGVAYQRSFQRAFSATILKRHVGLGPQGLGAVYTIDYSTPSPKVGYFSLQGLTPAVGPVLDFGSVRREIVDSEIDESMPYALSTVDNRIRRASYDVDAFGKVCKTAFGDIDMGEDGRTLYMVNAYQRSIITMDVDNENLVPTREKLRHYLIEDLPGIPNLNFRFRQCINAGGNTNVGGAESFTDINRVAWDKNRYSSGGNFAYTSFTVANAQNSIDKTSGDELYQTYRKGDFSYVVPVPMDETYEVLLHFAEPEKLQEGDRLFDIMLGDEVVVENFDIVKHAGSAQKATILKLDLTSKDNILDLRFVSKFGVKKKEALLSGLEIIGQSISESGVLRPWGIAFHKGRGYLGIVSDASLSMSREHLFAYVLSFDPKNISAGFTEEVSFSLGYPRERASNADKKQPQSLRSSAWQPWVDSWEETMIPTKGEPLNIRNALLCSYAQPLVSEINFSSDGSIIIGLMDRWAHQLGHNNYSTVLSDRTLIIGYACGDILKAFSEETGGYTLEKTNSDDGKFYRKDDGPSYNGEFFYEDFYATNLAHHGELITGGMTILPGTDEVAATVHNPLATTVPYFEFNGLFSQGLHFYDAATGKRTREYLFVDQYILGKANGLGDMEFASAPAPTSVGNYVWCDANANGVQDPAEFGINGINIQLLDAEDALAEVATVTTANGGEYYIDNLLPSHCYELRLDLSELMALGYTGGISPQLGIDSLSDSNGDDMAVPGFAIARFCTGSDGINRDDIDFGFLGPEALDARKVLCEDTNIPTMNPPCADFDILELQSCASNALNTTVRIYPSFNEADSMLNEITADVRVCGGDSIIYARVMINGDPNCYALSQVELIVQEADQGINLDFAEFVCPASNFDALSLLQQNGFRGDATTEFYTDVDKTIPYIGDPANISTAVGLPLMIYYDDTLVVDGCGICGSILLQSSPPSIVDAGDSASVCDLECIDLTIINATFITNGSGATQATWSTTGGGTFFDDNTFAGARIYCPDSADLLNGEVILYLTVQDDPCFNPTDSVVVTLFSGEARLIPGQSDTIDCTHPFVDDQLVNDTFPGCRIVVGCDDTIVGEIYDYDIILGDCDADIVKQIKRTFRIEYNKIELFCMDTIAVRGLPDTVICPPERDSVYCHTGYLKDESGHPSPLVTGVPMADSIPLWPQPNKICDILVTYKDLEFGDLCPITIRREWFIKNGCEGTFDSCVQWIMVFDTVPPTIELLDTIVSVPTGSHDCYAHVYVPPIRVTDTCTDVKMVKATIPNYGTAVLEYNATTGLYESHKQFKLPLGEILELPNGLAIQGYEVIYEALDFCHNDTMARDTIFVTDGTRPVAVCDKGLNVTVSDTTVWVHAKSIDEGSWDNCSDLLVLARRSDWYKACGVDLCDSIVPVCSTPHHDTVWCSALEQDKHINPIEAHYAKQLEWLCTDKSACNSLLLAGWAYDLMKYATLHCKDHPYQVDDSYFKTLLSDCDLDNLSSVLPCGKASYGIDGVNAGFDYLKLVLGQYLKDDELEDGFIQDIGAQLGGGWSEEVPFCCEDACQDVTVELLVMDYWCNWSKCWTTVRVEDKTPPKVVCELYDVTVSCASYKTYYAGAVDLALEGDFDSLQSVLGTYDKVQFDQYDNVAEKSTFDLYDMRCDSNLVTKDSLFYDEHLGYIWKEYTYYRAAYDTIKSVRYNGQIADNCGLVCIEEKPWVNFDYCGYGYIKRVFKFVGQCSTDGSGHTADTIVRTQTIWVTNDCAISPAMFAVPKDTIVYACGIEYAQDGSGHVAGLASPNYTGEGVYTFDNDCRLVGIGYYDKVFKIVGGDEACYKVIRTWCFADWCDLGEAALDTDWWLDKAYEGKYLSFTQKIIMLDSTPPICRIDSIPQEVDAIGCYYDLHTKVEVEDQCGLLRYSWQLIDSKNLEVIKAEDGEFDSSTSNGFPVEVEGLVTGTYKLKVIITDECQNESICDVPFVVNTAKKPSPVCISSLTIELTPMDTDNDGTVDTAMAQIDADQFDVSSTAACGKDNADLVFRIDRSAGEAVLPESSATKLYVGCEDVGAQSVRMYVLDESGSWDYCEVLLIVQNNMGGCGDISVGTTNIYGSIETELNDAVELVDIQIEDAAGNLLEQVSQVNGFYELDMSTSTEAFIRPIKNRDHLNGVSTRDLIDIQKHVLGSRELDSWYKVQAADANMDNKVSPLDLILLRKLILGMNKELPSSPSWRFFNPDSRQSVYPVNVLTTSIEADFIGVKVGDVNLDNNPSRSAARSSESLVLTAKDQRLTRGTHLIPIRSSNFSGIEGFQFTLEFDPSKVQVQSIGEGTSLDIGMQHFNLQNLAEGWISASWNDSRGSTLSLEPDAVLFYIKIESSDDVQLSDAITISSKHTPTEAYYASGLQTDVALSFPDGIHTDQLTMYQNRPNPWREHTVIGFVVPAATSATLTIFDLTGKVVKMDQGEFGKGYHEWQLDKSAVTTSGVFYYKIETAKETAIRRMILMH